MSLCKHILSLLSLTAERGRRGQGKKGEAKEALDSKNPFEFEDGAPGPDLRQRQLIFDSLQKIVNTANRTKDPEKSSRGMLTLGKIPQITSHLVYFRRYHRFTCSSLHSYLFSSDLPILWSAGTYVFTWGAGYSGQLGRRFQRDQKRYSAVPMLITLSETAPHGIPVRQVACGQEHTALVTEGGHIYTWGDGRNGQLGHLHKDAARQVPQQVVRPDNVFFVQVACGRDHTVAVTDTGTVYSWGHGKSGQLGHGDRTQHDTPYLIRHPECTDIVMAACGNKHTVLLSASGKVISFGSGEHGQTGHGDSDERNSPTVIKSMEKHTAIYVACGPIHTCIVTSAGHVYVCGFGEYFLAGDGSKGAQHFFYTPTHVPIPAHIKQVACGQSHILALSTTGQVYAWGASDYGQVGWGMHGGCSGPRLVLDGCDIAQVAAGKYHSVALSTAGLLWSWGCGENGQLGHGTDENVLIPKPIKHIEGKVVGHVACGEHHTTAMTAAPWSTASADIAPVTEQLAKEYREKLKSYKLTDSSLKYERRERKADGYDKERADKQSIPEILSEDAVQQTVERRVKALNSMLEQYGGQLAVAVPPDADKDANQRGGYDRPHVPSSVLASSSSSSSLGSSNEGAFDPDQSILDFRMAQHPGLRLPLSNSISMAVGNGPSQSNGMIPSTFNGATVQSYVLADIYDSSLSPATATPSGQQGSALTLYSEPSTSQANGQRANDTNTVLGGGGNVGGGNRLPISKSHSTAELLLPSIKKGSGNVGVGPNPLTSAPSKTHRGLAPSSSLAATLPASSGEGTNKHGIPHALVERLSASVAQTHEVRGNFFKTTARMVTDMTQTVQDKGEQAQQRELKRLVRHMFEARKEYDRLVAEANTKSKEVDALKQELALLRQRKAAADAFDKECVERVKELEMQLNTVTIKIGETEENRSNYITNISHLKEEHFENVNQLKQLRQSVAQCANLMRKVALVKQKADVDRYDAEKQVGEFRDDIREYNDFINGQLAKFESILNVVRAHNEKRRRIREQQKEAERKKREEEMAADEEKLATKQAECKEHAATLIAKDMKLSFYEDSFAKIVAATGLVNEADITAKFHFNSKIREQLQEDIKERTERIAELEREERRLRQVLADAVAAHTEKRWKDVDKAEEEKRVASHKSGRVKEYAGEMWQKLALVQEGILSLTKTVANTIAKYGSVHADGASNPAMGGGALTEGQTGQSYSLLPPTSSSLSPVPFSYMDPDEPTSGEVDAMVSDDEAPLWSASTTERVLERLHRDMDSLLERERDVLASQHAEAVESQSQQRQQQSQLSTSAGANNAVNGVSKREKSASSSSSSSSNTEHRLSFKDIAEVLSMPSGTDLNRESSPRSSSSSPSSSSSSNEEAIVEDRALAPSTGEAVPDAVSNDILTSLSSTPAVTNESAEMQSSDLGKTVVAGVVLPVS